MFDFFVLMIVGFSFSGLVFFLKTNLGWKKPRKPFSASHRQILEENISFYNALEPSDKTQFEKRIAEFMLNYKFVGSDTQVTDKDKILVACSAIIPIFSFPDWRYNRLKQIIVFPDNFNRQFQVGEEDSNIRGLVGFGYMEGKLCVSRTALYSGFETFDDKRNTCLHEFIHLIDMEDGEVDGVPEKLLQHKYTIPWIFIMNKEIMRIKAGYSDIHDYAGTNKAEFFAVVSEYFFERPEDFKYEHPRLFNVMNEIFKPKSSIFRRKSVEKS